MAELVYASDLKSDLHYGGEGSSPSSPTINMTKTKSDEKNNTEALTFPNSAIEDDEQAKAFHINSIRKSNREINRLASVEDYEADYWDGLLDS